jgi:hypothetical protein
MPQSGQPSGFGQEILQPFNIPTSVNAPVRTGPRMNLTFPVFTPPAASSYGSTMPMRVPWEPPNLAGAISDGLKTGANLATQYLTNQKTAKEVQAQEAASSQAIAAMHDPSLKRNISYGVSPSGFTATVISPAEADIARANLAKTGAETEEAYAGAAQRRGLTPEAQAKTAQSEAETRKIQMETGYPNVFSQRAAASKSGFITTDAATDGTTGGTGGATDGTNINWNQ